MQSIPLGAIAGFTIYIGLSVGRLQTLDTRARVTMAMFSVGVLAFIFVDVLSSAIDMVHSALGDVEQHHGSLEDLMWRVMVLATGFVGGSAGLAVLDRRMCLRGARTPPIAGGSEAPALTLADADALRFEVAAHRRRALQTGVTIAAAIGVHNFAEGLAIGVSARAGSIRLATVLIIGFALHNATEGFGIVGPLGDVRPSWRWLGMAGLIGGGPTFLGSVVGYGFSSQLLELISYAFAAGAILYVIGEVWNSMRRHGHRELGLLLLSVGFMVGLMTDLIVVLGSS